MWESHHVDIKSYLKKETQKYTSFKNETEGQSETQRKWNVSVRGVSVCTIRKGIPAIKFYINIS